MLKRVRVRGYKCLSDVTVDLGPFNVLIGRNDSGKSSFLQAIAEPTYALTRGGSSRWSRLGGSVRMEGPNGAALFSVVPPHSARLEVGAFGAPEDALSEMSWPTGGADIYWTTEQRDFVSTDPISLDPDAIAGHATGQAASIEMFVGTRGGGTAAHLAALALGDRERFDSIEGALRKVTQGRVKDIVVRDVGNSTYQLHFRLFDGRVIQAVDLSQGLLLYVAFLSLIHRDPVPAVILIEEPETGLHPMRLFEVVDLLRTLTQRGVQVILTTHSPDLLSACKPAEVRIFYRPTPESPTQVHALPADFERRAMGEPLGQVWAARGEEGLLDLVTAPLIPPIQADPK